MIPLINDGKWKDREILSPESIKLMQQAYVPIVKSPVPKMSNPHFGLSWFIHSDQGQTASTQIGAGAVFVAQIRIYPEKKIGVAVISNSTYLEKDIGTSLISKLVKLLW